MMVQSQISQQKHLMDAFDFTADDLAANRANALTPQQRKRLIRAARMTRRFGRCAIIVFLLTFGAIIGVLIWVRLTASSPQGAPPWPLIGGLGGFLALIIAYAAISNHKTVSRLANPRIQIRSGPAELTSKTVNHGRWQLYFLTLDGLRFQLPLKEQFNALQEGQQYRVYYLEYSPTTMVLSIEAL